MASRWTAWMVWAALAASLVFWGLRLTGAGVPVPVHARTVDTAQAAQGDPLRLFGATADQDEPAAVAPAPSRFRLVGVIAPSAPGSAGWALISVDGKAARAVRIGARVDGEWILQAVTQNRVELGPHGAPAAAVLDLASLPAAATGTLAMAPTGEPQANVGPESGVGMPQRPSASGNRMVGVPPTVRAGVLRPEPASTPQGGEPPPDLQVNTR